MAPQISEEKLAELTERIVAAVEAKRTILFGSVARGEIGPESDLDVLVVVPDGVHRGQATERIYRGLWGFGLAKDIVVVTVADVEKHREDPFTVIRQALTEGRELYRAA